MSTSSASQPFDQEPLGLLAAHLDSLLDMRVHQLAHRVADTSP
jgi:hypothetical protein